MGGTPMGAIVVTKLQTASGSNSNVSKIVVSDRRQLGHSHEPLGRESPVSPS